MMRLFRFVCQYSTSDCSCIVFRITIDITLSVTVTMFPIFNLPLIKTTFSLNKFNYLFS